MASRDQLVTVTLGEDCPEIGDSVRPYRSGNRGFSCPSER